MPDLIHQPYVAMLRARRIDIAGPFETKDAALDWALDWEKAVDDGEVWQFMPLDPIDPFAILSWPPASITGRARCCAPGHMSRRETMAWAITNEHRFTDGFPAPEPSTPAQAATL